MRGFSLLKENEDLFIQSIKQINVNDVDSYGSSILQAAIVNGKINAALALIEHGAELDFQNKDGHTPLHYALIYGLTILSEKMLKLGANPNLKDKHGNNALWISLLNNGKINTPLTPLLLKAGADPLSVNKYGKSTLDIVKQMNLEDLNKLFNLV